MTTTTKLAVGDRFWAKVNKGIFCWEWQGAKATGYGHFRFEGRMVMAHRWAYEAMVGPIPEGLEIDHLCRNRPCVRPDHLEAVKSRENVLRSDGLAAQYAQRTHCNKGHEFTLENTIKFTDRPATARRCRTCMLTRSLGRCGACLETRHDDCRVQLRGGGHCRCKHGLRWCGEKRG